jgi:hypothetical protein
LLIGVQSSDLGGWRGPDRVILMALTQRHDSGETITTEDTENTEK